MAVPASALSLWTAIAVAAGLTQIGELSFAGQTARAAGMVAEDVFSDAVAASLISILLNVFIVRAVFAWVAKKHPVPAKQDAAA